MLHRKKHRSTTRPLHQQFPPSLPGISSDPLQALRLVARWTPPPVRSTPQNQLRPGRSSSQVSYAVALPELSAQEFALPEVYPHWPRRQSSFLHAEELSRRAQRAWISCAGQSSPPAVASAWLFVKPAESPSSRSPPRARLPPEYFARGTAQKNRQRVHTRQRLPRATNCAAENVPDEAAAQAAVWLATRVLLRPPAQAQRSWLCSAPRGTECRAQGAPERFHARGARASLRQRTKADRRRDESRAAGSPPVPLAADWTQAVSRC